jgi:hypothetical protein
MPFEQNDRKSIGPVIINATAVFGSVGNGEFETTMLIIPRDDSRPTFFHFYPGFDERNLRESSESCAFEAAAPRGLVRRLGKKV